MSSTNDRRSDTSAEARPASPEAVQTEVKHHAPAAPADQAVPPGHQVAPTATPPSPSPKPSEAPAPSHPWRKWVLLAGAVVGLAVGAHFLVPTVDTMLSTGSTDDAYVNGHVTFVAPRVA